MDEKIIRYVEWMKSLKTRFFPSPSKKRVEKPAQKVVEGTAPKPEQDVFTED